MRFLYRVNQKKAGLFCCAGLFCSVQMQFLFVGLLHEGDEIMEINGNPVKGKTVNEVVEILREIEGTLTFLLLPGGANRKSPIRENNKFFRAQFDYDPMDDNYLPCRELGLPFRKGDILEIQNQEDPNWWQVRNPFFTHFYIDKVSEKAEGQHLRRKAYSLQIEIEIK